MPVITMHKKYGSALPGFTRSLKYKQSDSAIFKAVMANFSGIVRIEGVAWTLFDDFLRSAEAFSVGPPIPTEMVMGKDLVTGFKHINHAEVGAYDLFFAAIDFEMVDVSDVFDAEDEEEEFKKAMNIVLKKLMYEGVRLRRERRDGMVSSRNVKLRVWAFFMEDTDVFQMSSRTTNAVQQIWGVQLGGTDKMVAYSKPQ